MYNNIHDEEKMYEGKKIILQKDKVLKTYPVPTTQISKQQTLQECFCKILSSGFEFMNSKNLNKKFV